MADGFTYATNRYTGQEHQARITVQRRAEVRAVPHVGSEMTRVGQTKTQIWGPLPKNPVPPILPTRFLGGRNGLLEFVGILEKKILCLCIGLVSIV